MLAPLLGGGLIVAAKMASTGPTDEILFSRDEGLCWEGPIKLERPLNVHNIRIEPTNKGHIFVVHGTDAAPHDGDPKGVVYVVNFRDLHLADGVSTFQFNECDASADYELWQPLPVRRCMLDPGLKAPLVSTI